MTEETEIVPQAYRYSYRSGGTAPNRHGLT